MLDALAIGVLFQRVSRAQARANTLVISSKAVIRRIRGELYLMFQICEMRKHQLVEAHVRMYTIRHDIEQGEHYYFQSYPMRVQHPDDDLGGMLLLALPSIVVHRLDAWSPLLRPKSAASCGFHHNPATSYMFPEVLVRRADGENGDRDDQMVGKNRSQLCNKCRCEKVEEVKDTRTHQEIIDDIKSYWEESQVQILMMWWIGRDD